MGKNREWEGKSKGERRKGEKKGGGGGEGEGGGGACESIAHFKFWVFLLFRKKKKFYERDRGVNLPGLGCVCLGITGL